MYINLIIPLKQYILGPELQSLWQSLWTTKYIFTATTGIAFLCARVWSYKTRTIQNGSMQCFWYTTQKYVANFIDTIIFYGVCNNHKYIRDNLYRLDIPVVTFTNMIQL